MIKIIRILSKHSDLIILLLVCLTALSLYLAKNPVLGEKDQWDFRAHYFSTLAFNQGLDPYNNRDVNQINDTGHEIWAAHTYPYHPFTLCYFKFFTLFPFSQARVVYLWYNSLLVFLLIVIWKKFFLPNKVSVLAFAVILIFAFNNTLHIALRAGNTAIMEAFVIWLAFALLINGRSLSFLLLITFISFFKGTPLLFMPLVLLLPETRKRIREMLAVAGGFALLYLSPLLIRPKLFLSYWNYAVNVREVGWINPCAYSLITDLCKGLGKTILIDPIYFLWIVMVLGIFWAVLKRRPWQDNKIAIVFLAFLSYTVIVPRFKDYAYVQLLPICYQLITRHLGYILFAFSDLFIKKISFSSLLNNYHTFIAALAGWCYLTYDLIRGKNGRS